MLEIIMTFFSDLEGVRFKLTCNIWEHLNELRILAEYYSSKCDVDCYMTPLKIYDIVG
jgi:hypothetical protein